MEPTIALEGNDLALVRSLVAEGIGLAILPRTFAELPGPAVALRPLNPALRMAVALWWRRGRHLSPAARAFTEFVRRASALRLALGLAGAGTVTHPRLARVGSSVSAATRAGEREPGADREREREPVRTAARARRAVRLAGGDRATGSRDRAAADEPRGVEQPGREPALLLGTPWTAATVPVTSARPIPSPPDAPGSTCASSSRPA